MSEFLFMYPIQDYVDACHKTFFAKSETQPNHIQTLNQLIKERYRTNGVRINWLLFNQIGSLIKPDATNVISGLEIDPYDKVLVAGSTFNDLRFKKVYPDPEYVIAQLEEPITDLTIGGFHLFDCVERVAQSAHSQGINTNVDIDLTELLFSLRYRAVTTDQLRDPNQFRQLRQPQITRLHTHQLQLKSSYPWLAQL